MWDSKVKAQKNQGMDNFIVEEDIGNKNQSSSGCVAKLDHLQDEVRLLWGMPPNVVRVSGQSSDHGRGRGPRETEGGIRYQLGRTNGPSRWGQEEGDQKGSQRDRFGFPRINRTHQSTWADIQSLMEILLTPEERRMVRGTMDKALQMQQIRTGHVHCRSQIGSLGPFGCKAVRPWFG
ncbi:hypothetical protein L345_04727, partial [Ophiophagus hannah]